MSIEAATYHVLKSSAAVTALVGGSSGPRIYPNLLPQGKAVPAILFEQISSDVEMHCDGQEDLRTDRIQITIWDDDPDGARALADLVRSTLQASGARGSHGGSTIQYWALINEGDAISAPADNEDLVRFGKRQDWEAAYV